MAETTRNVSPVPPFAGVPSSFGRWLGIFVASFNRQRVRHGNGTPEAVITASPGTLYCNDDGGAGATVWYKSTGTGNTGWSAVA